MEVNVTAFGQGGREAHDFGNEDRREETSVAGKTINFYFYFYFSFLGSWSEF